MVKKKKDNPEQAVVDAIDELVSESLARPITDSYNAPWHDKSGNLLCDLCKSAWHGLQKYDCPGAYATDEQAEAYRESKKEDASGRAGSSAPFSLTGFSGPCVAYHSWLDLSDADSEETEE